MTNDACYSSGALIPGFSIDAIPVSGIGQMAVLTPTFLGVTSVAVGPNYFDDDTSITFPGGSVDTAGMLILSPTGATVVDIEIFGPGDVSLGTTSLNIDPTPIFFGVQALNSSITRIELTNGSGELIDNLDFGQCVEEEIAATTIPSVSEWGLVATAAVLGFIGMLAVYRRRAVS